MVNKLFVQSTQVDESGRAKMSTLQQQEPPVNFIWGEPVHAENLRGAQV
jgi:hypothetical protein